MQEYIDTLKRINTKEAIDLILEIYTCVKVDIKYKEIMNWIDMTYTMGNKKTIIHLVYWFCYHN